MLVATLLALAAAPGWVLGTAPAGYQLVLARDLPDGSRVTSYARTLHDPYDAPLTITATPSAVATVPLQPETTVHGRPADLVALTDDGRVYGRGLVWDDPSGDRIAVERDGHPSDALLRAWAESSAQVTPERWSALKIATSFTPDRPPPGSRAVRVGSGRVGGRRWTLTALLPPGFPVAPEDHRAACVRVRFKGARSTACPPLPAWRRVGGTVFVY